MRPRWRDCAKQARHGRRHREGPFIDSRAPRALPASSDVRDSVCIPRACTARSYKTFMHARL
ncbi:hypothetical protein [Lysobacter gummosus]|uniref:hypothetical protein n=1 Tax=Lysobacter gummosus TaxID=262324 RepID=UPI003626F05C